MADDIRDPTIDWDNVDYEAISDFLDNKGAVELLAFLDAFGYRFDEIDNALDVSRGYINSRKDEALNLNLIYPDQEERDGSVRRVWSLTPLGLCVAHQMEHFDVTESHGRLISARDSYNKKKSRFLQWAIDPENVENLTEKIRKKNDNWATDISPAMRKGLHDSDEKRY